MKSQTRVPRQNGVRRVGEPYDRTFVERHMRLRDQVGTASRVVQRAAEHVAEWEAEARAVCEPFGLDFRTVEPAVVDVLSWSHPDGEHWRWTGRTNNKGLPVIRTRVAASLNTEWSAMRVLHRALCDHEPPGAMHPRCGDRMCIRLSHRCPRCAE